MPQIFRSLQQAVVLTFTKEETGLESSEMTYPKSLLKSARSRIHHQGFPVAFGGPTSVGDVGPW